MDYGLLALVVAIAIGVNLPFGAWRTTTPRLSVRWFLAIHLPIPAIFIMRRAAGFGWDYVPVMIACALGGQLLGGWLFQKLRPRRAARAPEAAGAPPTARAAERRRAPQSGPLESAARLSDGERLTS